MDEGPPEAEYQARSYACVSFCNFSLYDHDLTCAHPEGTVFPTELQVVSLETAQAMNPRPPSPNSAAATQRALRSEIVNKLPTREGGTLTKMRSVQALSSSHGQKDKVFGRPRSGSFTSGNETKGPVPLSKSIEVKPPVRPPRDERREGLIRHLEVRGLILPLYRVDTHEWTSCYTFVQTAPVCRAEPYSVGKWPPSRHADKSQGLHLQRTRAPPDCGLN